MPESPGTAHKWRAPLTMPSPRADNPGENNHLSSEAAVSLLGTLDTLSLPDLFELLAVTSKTGALHVRGERGLGVVYFAGGKVCGGEAGEQSGPVDGRQALLARLHDVCFELFRFEDGSFEFEGDRHPAWPVAGEVEVADLVTETNRRLDEWREILTVVSSVEVRPRLVAEPPAGNVTLDRAQWRVVTGIDGRRRVSALIRVLDGSEFDVCKTLKGLVEAGLVELDAGEPQARGDAPGEVVAEPAPRREATRRPARSGRASAAAGNAAGSDAPEEEADPGVDTTQWDDQVLAVDADGLNRGAVVAFLSDSRKR